MNITIRIQTDQEYGVEVMDEISKLSKFCKANTCDIKVEDSYKVMQHGNETTVYRLKGE